MTNKTLKNFEYEFGHYFSTRGGKRPVVAVLKNKFHGRYGRLVYSGLSVRAAWKAYRAIDCGDSCQCGGPVVTYYDDLDDRILAK